MTGAQPTDRDLVLIKEAHGMISERFRDGYHHVGAALRTRNGRVFSAVHLEAYVGRIAVCAEAIALGMAAAAGDTDVEIIVATNRHGEVVAPCGMCRELITDYAPDCQVIIPGVETPLVVHAGELLPSKYKR